MEEVRSLTSGTRQRSGVGILVVAEEDPTRHGDVVQSTVRCARMSQREAEEAVVAPHAVGHDGVRRRHRVLLSHHRG